VCFVDDAVTNVVPLRSASVDVELPEENNIAPLTSISVMYDVELAWSPAWNQIGVDVEFAAEPKFVVGVHAKAAPPPPPDPIQVPLTAKQPEVIFSPPPSVDVAVVVPTKLAPTMVPATESLAYGELVPMPTLPP
jgi:hypothetical protein